VYAKQGSRRDTLITLSADWAIHFSRFDEEIGLWYEPRLVDLNKRDTITIEGLHYENGSELFIKISPNSDFFVLDNIFSGYEMDDNSLHESYGCLVIDIKNANTPYYMTNDCDGEWDSENNWVSGIRHEENNLVRRIYDTKDFVVRYRPEFKNKK
jgi:hypothetical protein